MCFNSRISPYIIPFIIFPSIFCSLLLKYPLLTCYLSPQLITKFSFFWALLFSLSSTSASPLFLSPFPFLSSSLLSLVHSLPHSQFLLCLFIQPAREIFSNLSSNSSPTEFSIFCCHSFDFQLIFIF